MKPRFVWTAGSYRETYPDIPEMTALVLWDRQEGKPVVTLHDDYAQLLCLEHVECGQPFTELEQWANGLSNVALASEGLPTTV